MSRFKIVILVAFGITSLLLLTLSFSPQARAALRGLAGLKADPDADLPSSVDVPADFSKEDFMLRRAESVELRRGISKDAPLLPGLREAAIAEMEAQEARLAQSDAPSGQTTWTALGPAPIPNGQFGPVSGRTVSIAVHPTNPNLVYVGTAQGGLYRTTDGGANWTPILENSLSFAIGALALAPSQPDTLYVGTGEATFSGLSFFGVGVYRIDNASSATPTISGPFNDNSVDTDIFTGRSIGEIIVHPTQPGTIFVASASGIGGIGTQPSNVLPARGIYRSTNATSADPTFEKLTGLAANTDSSVRDIAIDPLNPDLLVANVIAVGGLGGIYTSSNATTASPTFTQTAIFTSTSTSELTAEFAVHRVAGPTRPSMPPRATWVAGSFVPPTAA